MRAAWVAPALPLALLTAGCPFGEGARPYAVWTIPDHAAGPFGCAHAEAWVSTSGREGVGITVRLRAPIANTEPCRVSVEATSLHVRRGAVAGDRLPPPAILKPGAEVRAYVGFRYDDDAAWREEVNGAVLEIVGQAGAAPATIILPLMREVTP